MKVLWITQMKPPTSNDAKSGGWVMAAAEQISGSIELEIAYPGRTSESYVDGVFGLRMHSVAVPLRRGKVAPEDRSRWEQVLRACKPDVIQIWGTEYSTGLSVIQAANGRIPCLVYIQGVVSAIAAQKYGGLSLWEMAAGQGALAHFRAASFARNWHALKRQVEIEYEIVSRSSGIICDSDWCEAQYRSMCPDVMCFKHFLPLKEQFLRSEAWSYEKCKKDVIFTIAGRGPLKGIHELIVAVALVKKRIPAVQLVIPGDMTLQEPSWLRGNVYISMLKKMIKEFELQQNVSFSGALSADQMIDSLRQANVFVMPSCIENHSSSLREAMALGVPSVSSAVGAVTETIYNSFNGYLYRYGDVATLADRICFLLQNDSESSRIGSNARQTIQRKISDTGFCSLEKIYNSILDF